MFAATVRSGLIESVHEWSAAVVARNGRILRTWGSEADRTIFARSTVKPFQATISQRFGAKLPAEYLAVAAASHSGTPAHIAVVGEMLRQSGLTAADLACPPDLPLGVISRRRWIRDGRAEEKVAHNCSGKHAAFLRACRNQGWPTETYLDRDHPIQQNTAQLLSDVLTENTTPFGVDGCGAPTFRISVIGLATAFAALSIDEEFSEVRTAMRRYPALIADNQRADGQLGRWWDGPAKVGAEGLMALGRDGIGVAVKSHDGSPQIATLASIEVLSRMNMLQPHVIDALENVSHPAVLGGGERVGAIVPDSTKVDPS